jgi:ATP-dependent RNA helicase DDX19/DBP5
LKPDLLQGIYAMGFTKPSKIQETALPALINNPPQNLIAQSQSGTGKTAAFTLTMLSRVDPTQTYPQVKLKIRRNYKIIKSFHIKALCLAPTMELAAQIADVAQKMGQFVQGLTIVLAVKGQHVERNVPITNQIIIGTPGTVLDWSGKLNVLDLKKLKVFVLDEADVMISQQGHHEFCIRIVKGLSKQCQMMLFSATYNDKVLEFATHIVKDPMIIRLRRKEESLDYIKQFYVICESDHSKFNTILDLYQSLTVGQAIIFCEVKLI